MNDIFEESEAMPPMPSATALGLVDWLLLQMSAEDVLKTIVRACESVERNAGIGKGISSTAKTVRRSVQSMRLCQSCEGVGWISETYGNGGRVSRCPHCDGQGIKKKRAR